jgi:hypothetical protein
MCFVKGFSGQAARISKSFPLVKEIPVQDLRDAEDEMLMENLL